MQFDELSRREFLTLLGVAAAWPLAARAQQAESTPRIGVLWPGDAPPASPRMESFRQGLRALGFVDGQNVAIELLYAGRSCQFAGLVGGRSSPRYRQQCIGR